MYKTILTTICLFTNLLLSTIVKADNGELDRKIKLPRKKENIYKLLKDVSDKTGFLFIYDSEVIDNNKPASISKGEYTIREAIYTITGNRNIKLSIIENYILISSPREEKQEISSESAPPKEEIFTVHGQLYDKLSGTPIPYAAVGITDHPIGTITNQDGEFKLVLPDSLLSSSIRFSHVGYQSENVKTFLLADKYMAFSLEPKIVPLQEVVVRAINPKDILAEMLEKREQNYAAAPVYSTAFYREGVRVRNKDIDLTEAVLKIYKTGYNDNSDNYQVKLLKKRQINDRRHEELIIAKMRSGIYSCLQLDIVKTIPDFLANNKDQLYDYTYTNMTVIDGRKVYIISFEQKPNIKEALFKGDLYIDTENHALLQAEFEVHPDYIKKVAGALIEKKSKSLDLTPKQARYLLTYKELDGVYYINHIRIDLNFRVKEKRRLFSSSLDVWCEMVNCMTEVENVLPIPKEDRVAVNKIFSDAKFEYDKDFWGSFNIIVQEDKLRESVLQILEKQSR